MLNVTIQKQKSHQADQLPDHKKASNRGNLAWLSGIIKSIPSDKKPIISDYGFPFVFHLKSFGVPRSFAQWIANHIQPESCDIILYSGVIHLGADSFSEVIELDNSGWEVKADFDGSKDQFLSFMGFSDLPTIKQLGKMLLTNDLANEKYFICFMVLFLSSFLCPNSSTYPSTKYLGSLLVPSDARNYNWASFGHNWFIESVRKYQKDKVKSKALSSKSNLTLGGCNYVAAVKYLDFADFGEVRLDNCFPRTLVWKHDLIKEFAHLDHKNAYEYGLRNVRDLSRTCYAVASKSTSACSYLPDFKSTLESLFHNSLPDKVLEDICNLFKRSEIYFGPDVMSAAGEFAIAVLECVKEASDKLQGSTSSGKESSPIVYENFALFSGCVQNCNENSDVIAGDAAIDSQATDKVVDPDDIERLHEVPNEAYDAETVTVNSDEEELSNQGRPLKEIRRNHGIDEVFNENNKFGASNGSDHSATSRHDQPESMAMNFNCNEIKTKDPIVQSQPNSTADLVFVPDALPEIDHRETLEHGHSFLTAMRSDLNDCKTIGAGVELQSETIIPSVSVPTASHQCDHALPTTQDHAPPTTSPLDFNKRKTTATAAQLESSTISGSGFVAASIQVSDHYETSTHDQPPTTIHCDFNDSKTAGAT